jgi:RNA polymerase sigma-70 factor (sigma-E family)
MGEGAEGVHVDEAVADRRAETSGSAPDGLPTGLAPAGSFDAFAAAHGSRLLRTAFLLTGDHGAAEDLLQDTLVRAWARWARVSSADEPLAYVRRMLVNASVSRWRALRRRQDERLFATPPEHAAPDPDRHDDQMWQLVSTLPPRQRAVVVLSYYEDLSDGQVADALGTAVGTVKSQRAKALRALRARLGQEES